MSNRVDFCDLTWLFTCDNRNRGILRMNFDEAALLWKSVRTTDGAILEVGRRHAGSTVLLCAAAGSREVVSIDIAPQHAPQSDAFLKQPTVADRVTLIISDSRQSLPNRRFGMLFIDGDHSYEGVKQDTIAHWPALLRNGEHPALASFHDAVPNPGLVYAGELNHCPGVRQLCEELVNAGAAKKHASAGSLLVLEKVSELPAGF